LYDDVGPNVGSKWSFAHGSIGVMGARAEIAQQLSDAVESQSLVRIYRSPRNADTVGGFPLTTGSKWVLVAQTGDGGFFDGLVAIRLKDVVKVQPDTSFESRFAQTQPEWPPTAPAAIDLASTGDLLKDLSQSWPLVGIEQEDQRNSAMIAIGVVGEIDDGWLWLREARPDATWRKRPRGYRLKDITKVVVADRYLTALSAIAGPPSTDERQ
jgi:hypothetical protein